MQRSYPTQPESNAIGNSALWHPQVGATHFKAVFGSATTDSGRLISLRGIIPWSAKYYQFLLLSFERVSQTNRGQPMNSNLLFDKEKRKFHKREKRTILPLVHHSSGIIFILFTTIGHFVRHCGTEQQEEIEFVGGT